MNNKLVRIERIRFDGFSTSQPSLLVFNVDPCFAYQAHDVVMVFLRNGQQQQLQGIQTERRRECFLVSDGVGRGRAGTES